MRIQKAFTLVEMLIYMGLVSVVLVVITGILHTVLDVQLASRANSAVDSTGPYLVTRLSYDLRHATSVSLPLTAGSTTSILTLSRAGQIYSYSIQNQQLVLTVDSETLPVTAPDVLVNSFSVTKIGGTSDTPTYQINLTLSSSSVSLDQESETRTYQTTVSLR